MYKTKILTILLQNYKYHFAPSHRHTGEVVEQKEAVYIALLIFNVIHNVAHNLYC